MHGTFWCQVLEMCQDSPSSAALPATMLLDLVVAALQAPFSKVTRPGLFSHIVWVSVFMFEPLVLLSWYFLMGIQTTEAMPTFLLRQEEQEGARLQSLFSVDPRAVATQRSALTSEGRKWLRVLLFFTEEWLKAPPAAIPTQPARGGLHGAPFKCETILLDLSLCAHPPEVSKNEYIWWAMWTILGIQAEIPR